MPKLEANRETRLLGALPPQSVLVYGSEEFRRHLSGETLLDGQKMGKLQLLLLPPVACVPFCCGRKPLWEGGSNETTKVTLSEGDVDHVAISMSSFTFERVVWHVWVRPASSFRAKTPANPPANGGMMVGR